jgi:hypothetical protein
MCIHSGATDPMVADALKSFDETLVEESAKMRLKRIMLAAFEDLYLNAMW